MVRCAAGPLGVALALMLSGCTKCGTGGTESSNGTTSNVGTEAPSENRGQEGSLVVEDLTKGEGAVAEAGKLVEVHYTGTLTNGTKFDSSRDRGTPFKFHLGNGTVIRGWDEGVAGMRVGGKRRLTIPPEMGYGAAGVPGVIPPDSTLVFEVELLGVE